MTAPWGAYPAIDPWNQNARFYGDVAILNGSVIASDRSGKEIDRTMFTHVFVRRDGRWQAVNAQENALRPMPQNGDR